MHYPGPPSGMNNLLPQLLVAQCRSCPVTLRMWGYPVTDQWKVLPLLTPTKVNFEWPAQLWHALWGWLKPSLGCTVAQLLPLPNPVSFSFPQVLTPRPLPNTHLVHPAPQRLLSGTQPATVVRSSLISDPYRQNYSREFTSNNNNRHL